MCYANARWRTRSNDNTRTNENFAVSFNKSVITLKFSWNIPYYIQPTTAYCIINNKCARSLLATIHDLILSLETNTPFDTKMSAGNAINREIDMQQRAMCIVKYLHDSIENFHSHTPPTKDETRTRIVYIYYTSLGSCNPIYEKIYK